MKLLSEYRDEIVATSTAAGWYEDTRTIGEECALLHSEISEMFEAYRNWGLEDKTLDKCMHDHPETSFEGEYCHPNHLCKPEGVGSEAADVLIRLLDTCNRQDVDVDVVDEQAQFLQAVGGDKPSDHVGDVIFELHKIVSVQIEKHNVAGLAVALLCYLRVVCENWGIDLMAETDRKIEFNKTRAYRHGGKRI